MKIKNQKWKYQNKKHYKKIQKKRFKRFHNQKVLDQKVV